MINQTIIDNGIRIITEQIPVAHSVSLGAWVTTGSRYEDAALSGISHFVEHMYFKGTEQRSARQIALEIDAVGGLLNAFTSHEYCCYYAKVLSHNLPLATDLISDILLNSVFSLDDIEKERRVILNEIAMVEDTPDDQVHELFSQMFWQGNSLGQPILGSRDSVSRFSRASILEFVKEAYCGNNLMITAAGNLEHQAVVDQVAERFAKVKPGRKPASVKAPEYRGGVDVRKRQLEQVHVCLGTKGLPQSHPDRFVIYFLNTILGGSMSSRLFQAIREERGLAYSIYSYLHSHSDAGALIVYAGTPPEDAYDVVALILRELHETSHSLVPDEEFAAAREQLKGNLLLSLESTENRMTRLAKNEIYLGKQPSIEESIDGIDKVTPEDVRTLASELFHDKYLTLQMLGTPDDADFSILDLTVNE
ncbi:MAG: peptidase M16 [Desulfuromonas sp.]|nr:MAG: peptidase M16 [Desulfuromonas sp.]